jgi:hypothetical protein
MENPDPDSSEITGKITGTKRIRDEDVEPLKEPNPKEPEINENDWIELFDFFSSSVEDINEQIPSDGSVGDVDLTDIVQGLLDNDIYIIIDIINIPKMNNYK